MVESGKAQGSSELTHLPGLYLCTTWPPLFYSPVNILSLNHLHKDPYFRPGFWRSHTKMAQHCLIYLFPSFYFSKTEGLYLFMDSCLFCLFPISHELVWCALSSVRAEACLLHPPVFPQHTLATVHAGTNELWDEWVSVEYDIFCQDEYIW